MQTRSPKVVGRDGEIDGLHRLLTSTRSGRGGAIFLVGEPGIGKSRLAAVATAQAQDDGLATLRGRVGALGASVAFRPLTEALLSLIRRGEMPAPESLGPYQQVLGRLVPDWDDGRSHDTATSAVVLGEAVLRLLALVGADRGCLLVLEDLHGSDPETLAVLEYLLDNLEDQPIALVITVRSESSAALELARLSAQRGTAGLIDLQPLNHAQVGELAAGCLEVPTNSVPPTLVDRLWQDSAGIPFIVEELLQEASRTGQLMSKEDGSVQVVDGLHTNVPAAVVRSISSRTNQLGPESRDLLVLAAVIGHRFPLSVVRKATGTDERLLLATLRAGLTAQLVGPDEPVPDWYAFRHPLTADALLAGLTPPERATLARRCADAIEELHPGLPGEWCPMVAELAETGGDHTRAGRLFAESGRRSFDEGSMASAVSLLRRANGLLSGEPDTAYRAEVLGSLLICLSETGQFEGSAEHLQTIEEMADRGLDSRKVAALHVQLANLEHMAGRWSAALTHVATARSLLGVDAGDADLAPVDAIAAHLELARSSPGRLRAATELATRAAAAAERAKLPAVACDSLQLLGILAREHDLDQSIDYFHRARLVAEEHQMTFLRVCSHIYQAGTICLATGSITELERARQQALRIGAIPLMYEVDGILGQQAILRSEYGRAATLIDECLEVTRRLRLGRSTSYFLATKAILEAHQGRRAAMEQTLAEVARLAGERASYELPYSYGLARTFCALLEENRELADSDLAQALAFDAQNPTTFHTSGKHGLALLLGVLSGRNGWAHFEAIVTTAAAGMRWNRQFVQMAHAILLGRDGQHDAANAKMTEAMESASLYPMARHLGMRLVAEPAHADGWGDPIAWLRQAEDYFHNAEIPAVAGVCRSLLRQLGATVSQRRTGSDQVPAHLRQLGITTREYEVCRLLVDRIGNKSIASRLHISPRTVEKHVASLMTKTQQPDREALSSFARTVLQD
ncbi:AAA family ATPase [Kribbella sandramycini]|uniref:AAA family ATPase n=1 Tax=Kribbella sandramycini TaxID=60450 RepID=A0A7Y4KZ17_9ACTN|nr:AAA family ATPase [Kribbella sandramycini]MBB6565022.1 DNA-binding CsgD family transcriptional regulator/tetratricopeptide (TPR) repeat protein [Kribbella sandramycini]NOL41294.1 AAA family ATPase [Kribbella sandramycini]